MNFAFCTRCPAIVLRARETFACWGDYLWDSDKYVLRFAPCEFGVFRRTFDWLFFLFDRRGFEEWEDFGVRPCWGLVGRRVSFTPLFFLAVCGVLRWRSDVVLWLFVFGLPTVVQRVLDRRGGAEGGEDRGGRAYVQSLGVAYFRGRCFFVWLIGVIGCLYCVFVGILVGFVRCSRRPKEGPLAGAVHGGASGFYFEPNYGESYHRFRRPSERVVNCQLWGVRFKGIDARDHVDKRGLLVSDRRSRVASPPSPRSLREDFSVSRARCGYQVRPSNFPGETGRFVLFVRRVGGPFFAVNFFSNVPRGHQLAGGVGRPKFGFLSFRLPRRHQGDR